MLVQSPTAIGELHDADRLLIDSVFPSCVTNLIVPNCGVLRGSKVGLSRVFRSKRLLPLLHNPGLLDR